MVFGVRELIFMNFNTIARVVVQVFAGFSFKIDGIMQYQFSMEKNVPSTLLFQCNAII